MNDCICDATADLGRADLAAPTSAAWMAVFSLAMGVFGLLTAEYLPASLLTPRSPTCAGWKCRAISSSGARAG